MAQSWRWRAACKGQDVELFFPYKETSGQAERAKAFCAVCPVTAECLNLAIDTNSIDGIFGGMTPTERTNYRRGNYNLDLSIVGHRDAPGTLAGFYREKSAGIAPCQECREAYNAHAREKQAGYRAAARGA